MKQLLLVFIGGGAGSTLRYLLGRWLNTAQNGIPYGTFAANILGSFLIGLILGWAFKANTNDSRESAAIKVSEILYKSGATLLIYDPKVQKKTIVNDIENLWEVNNYLQDNRIDIVKKLDDIKKIDVYVILTEWEEFNLIDSKESIVIFDGRNINQNKNKFSIGK